MATDAFLEDIKQVTVHLIRKLAPVFRFDDELETAIRLLSHNEVVFGRHDEIIAEGDPYEYVYLLHSGWVVRSKILETGQRQIVNFALPGDFLCFNAAFFLNADYHLTAQTEVHAAVIPIHGFSDMLATHSRLSLILSWTNAREESLLSERLVSLGRRSAKERMAHLFCELWRRLELLDLTDGNRFPLPITQEDLGDTLGLSAVHVNRTLRKLRDEQLIAPTPHHIRILDKAGLERAAGFDEGYLHFSEMHQVAWND